MALTRCAGPRRPAPRIMKERPPKRTSPSLQGSILTKSCALSAALSRGEPIIPSKIRIGSAYLSVSISLLGRGSRRQVEDPVSAIRLFEVTRRVDDEVDAAGRLINMDDDLTGAAEIENR